MRTVLVVALLSSAACKEEEPEFTIDQCPECAQHESCPSKQPGINPLEDCTEVDAECFYCSTVMKRFVCQEGQGAGTGGDGMPKWRDVGIPEMCPAPSDSSSGGSD